MFREMEYMMEHITKDLLDTLMQGLSVTKQAFVSGTNEDKVSKIGQTYTVQVDYENVTLQRVLEEAAKPRVIAEVNARRKAAQDAATGTKGKNGWTQEQVEEIRAALLSDWNACEGKISIRVKDIAVKGIADAKLSVDELNAKIERLVALRDTKRINGDQGQQIVKTKK